MPNPLFERADGEQEGPPAHLANATPDEINKYWMDRERKVKEELTAPPITTHTPPRQPNQPPVGMSPGQANTLIEGAKLLASQGKDLWGRFLPEVEGIMGQMTAEQRMDSAMWNTVYEKVCGMHMSELREEAKAAALKPPITESSSAASIATQPRSLSSNELHVVDQLRRAGAMARRKDATGKEISVPFDAEAYTNAGDKMSKGTLPLTYNNF